MALSMDEQRVLAEIERQLSSEEPRLAACMTSFRRPGPSVALRSPRARILGSLFTVMLVALISLMVYAIIPFRGAHGPGDRPGSVPGQTFSVASGRSSSGSVSVSTEPKASAVSHTTAAGVTAHARTAPAVKAAKAKSGTSG